MKCSKRWLILPVLTLILSCGGGDNGTGPGDDGGGGGGGGGTPTKADSLRVDTLNDIADELESWGITDRAEFAARAADYLNTIPGIAKAEVRAGTTTIWAIFDDGRLVIIPNNRDPSGPADTLLTAAEMSSIAAPPAVPAKRITIPTGRAAVRTLAPMLQGAGAGIPATNRYFAVNAIGNCHIDPLPAIRTLLKDNNYVGVPIGTPTVANLKKVRNAGVFYFNTHGGEGKAPDSTAVYGLWTVEKPSPALEARYRAMLDNLEVVYMYERSDDVDGRCRIVTHYGITPGFVAEYMSFAKNSLVFIDACSSFDPDLRTAVGNKNGSVFVGWTGKVDAGFAYRAAKFLFDRLLGANVVAPVEDPKQRPFRIDDVLKDMAGRNPSLTIDPQNGAELKMSREGGDFGLLSPSIMFVSLERGTDGMKMFVAGWFGDDPGPDNRQVTVGGVPVDVDANGWSSDLILCSIPNTGDGSAGAVRVEIKDPTGESPFPRWSNYVSLTRWKGKFTYTHLDPGGLSATIEMNVVVRADIHSFREKPHEPPFETIVLFDEEKATSASASAGGNYSQEWAGCTEVVSYGGSASLGSAWEGNDAGDWSYYGAVDSKEYKMMLSLEANAWLEGGNYAIVGPEGTCTPYSLPLGVLPRIEDCLFDERDLERRLVIPMINAGIYDIDRGARNCVVATLTYFSFTAEDGAAKIEWPQINSEFWPDPRDGR